MKRTLFTFLIFSIITQWVIAQNPVTYSTLVENQNTPFLKGDGEILVIDGVSWERPYGEKEYVLPPSMQDRNQYRQRITKLDDIDNNIVKSKFHVVNVEVTDQSRTLLYEMGIVLKPYVQGKVNVSLPEIDIDVLTQNGIILEYLTDYGTQKFTGEIQKDINTTTLYSEGFEVSQFPGTDFTAGLFGSANCGWDDVSCYKHSGSWSIWCASIGAACNSCLGDYVNNMGAEFNKNTTIATTGYNDFWFRWWMDYDFYNVGSNDILERYYWNGTSWTLSTTSYTSSSPDDGALWKQHSFFYSGSIPSYSFDFAFTSNSVGTSYGVYIDDITFEGTQVSTSGIIEQTVSEIAIYPNPCIDYTTISLECPIYTNAKIQVYSMDGRLIYNTTKSLVSGNNNFQLNTSAWEKGTYVLHITGDRISSHTILVKQ